MARIDVSLLSERVYRALREDIFRRVLLPATRLDVHQLAATYGTSAAPVRHALARLHDEGMVEIQPRRGTFVTPVRPRDVVEVFQIRRIVETGAAELLQARLPPEAGERLIHLVERTEELADGDDFRDYAAYIRLDADFHRLPLGALENPRLLRIFDNLHTHIQIARGLYPASDKRAAATLAEHRAILGAYLGHDVAAVKEAILIHLANGEADLLRRLPDEVGSGPIGGPGDHRLTGEIGPESARAAPAEGEDGRAALDGFGAPVRRGTRSRREGIRAT
jgi:DNA-binding GntR family transcriptional regulator